MWTDSVNRKNRGTQGKKDRLVTKGYNTKQQ